MSRIATTFVLLICLVIMAGCGGSTYAEYIDGHTSINKNWREFSGWDPFAPSLEITDMRTSLEATQAVTAGDWEIVALDEQNNPDTELMNALQFETTTDNLRIKTGIETDYVGLFVRYSADDLHTTTVDCDGDDRLSLSTTLDAGVLSIGIAAINEPIAAGELLADIHFAEGAAPVVRRPSFSQSDTNIVNDLEIVDNGDETVTASWSERNTGDYDLNSEVGAPDLVPIAQHYYETVSEGSDDYAILEVIDGDKNTEISSADIVPIAQNYGSIIQGYNIFRTTLSSSDETPDPANSSRWTKLENTANPSGPSIPRDLPAGQNFRLRYTFHDECGPGDFGWYVSAVGPGRDASTDGPACPAETLTVGSIQPPDAALSLAIMPPAGEFLSVNDEFYVAVSVENITGLSSVNVRLEYDSTLLEFVDGVGTYDSNANLLSNYLFLAVDNVGDAVSPYRLMGFNITQKQGTAAVTGSGVVGYLRFRAIGSGVSASAIRFPQATTYLLLWGEQYGVPVATPALGGPITVNIG